jgi:hypothetical protein
MFMDNTQYYPISKAAKLIGVSINTLRKWESDGIMIPAKTNGKHRRYSEEQIKNCHKNFDPDTAVTTLLAADIENFWLRAGTVCKGQLRKVDTIQEHYESLWCKLVEVSNIVHVKNCHIHPISERIANTLIVSPDVAALLYQGSPYGMTTEIGDKPITRQGTCSNAWKVYRCEYMLPGQILIGSTTDGTFDATSGKLARIQLENVVLF